LTSGIDHRARIARIREDTAGIAVAIDRFGTSAPVSHCGEWCVGDVVTHLGAVHRWATGIVQTGVPSRRLDTAPETGVELGEWLRQGADDLCAALERVAPETECWTFGGPPAEAGFWARRQMLETSIHRFDIESSVGVPTSISSEVAAEGINEVVDVLFPRQVELGRAVSLPGQVALLATDAEGRWVLGEPSAARAEISGPVVSLFLMLWKRPYPEMTREGDASVLAAAETTALTP